MRGRLRQLHEAATPPPWICEGFVYGVIRESRFHALGIAPHRSADSLLIAAYRSAVPDALQSLCAVERLVAGHGDLRRAAASILLVLRTFDETDGGAEARREQLCLLDREATPPPWDAGHLAYGMWIAEQEAAAGVAFSSPADADLIAEMRVGVPRLVGLLTEIEGIAASQLRHGGEDMTSALRSLFASSV